MVNVVKERLPSEEYYRGEADIWVHDRSKEVPPYYAKNKYSSTYQQGPTGRATVFCEKNVCPLTAGTHLTGTEGFVNLVNMH